MAGRFWKTTPPPKGRVRKPVRIQYKDSGRLSVSDFFWSKTEGAWIECVPGPDGIALYGDLYEVVAWR